MRTLKRDNGCDGFTLIEVLVASALLAVGLTAAMRLFAAATAANASARSATQATILALDKMEQFRALPLDDPAMEPWPDDALAADVAGYFDAPDPAFVRRWSIEPLPAFPEEGVVIRVAVMRKGTSFGTVFESIRAWKPSGGVAE